MTSLRDWRLRLMVGAAFAAWFTAVYFGADFIAQGFTARHQIATALDAELPFLPWLAPIYLAITPLLCAPLLVLDKTRDVVALGFTMGIEVAVAGLVFLVYPVEPPPARSSDNVFFGIADAVNLTYNTFPSLHVALSISATIAMVPDLSRPQASLLAVFTAAIVLSTLLTHQHYLADVATGLLMAVLAMGVIYPRLQGRFPRSAAEAGAR